MPDIQDNELWEEICFHLKNATSTLSEELYEQRIIMALEKMGWKQFKGEIVLKQSIPVGSANSIIPDIIVKSQEENISFVIEVKKPSITLSSDNRNQLFSYMRQLKLDFGVLFGEKLQIFYDGELSPSDSPTLLKTIEFDNNESNLDFINVFKKSTLSNQNLQNYARKQVDIANRKKEKNDLRKEILSSEFTSKLKEQAKRILLNNWDEERVDEIMSDIIISVKSAKENADNTASTQPQRPADTRLQNYPPGRVEYVFAPPPDEREFKRQLIQNGHAHINIFYSDGRKEYKAWNASRFTENSNLRGNINAKTWFRQDYVQRNGVVKAIFSIQPI